MLLLLFSFSPSDISPWSSEPPIIKGVYLSPGVIYSSYGLEKIYHLMDLGLLNTAVLDIKDEKGRVMFSLYKDFIREAKERGIYLIARQSVFKDRDFAFKERGKYSLKDTQGNIWFEEKSGYWVDPSMKEVRDYNVQILKKAFKAGFNEVQFDYIRYPSGNKPYLNNSNKLVKLLQFLDTAITQVQPGKKISLTVYGYAVWGEVLVKEGQNLEKMAKRVDAVYPMLYPSHFHNEFMRDLTKEFRTYSIIYESIRKARERLYNMEIRITPYIQAFDWKQSRLGKEYIINQLRAVHAAGGDGFILWEAGGKYDRAFHELIDLDIELSGKRLRLFPL
ncbi:MAG: hypothetical protein E3J23_08230 [Candidatus Stahlbacteria bacterium]|nr:MAG: hypothetical protein E3J23_08230 [Candidatus Stahlbacteria bacterium]